MSAEIMVSGSSTTPLKKVDGEGISSGIDGGAGRRVGWNGRNLSKLATQTLDRAEGLQREHGHVCLEAAHLFAALAIEAKRDTSIAQELARRRIDAELMRQEAATVVLGLAAGGHTGSPLQYSSDIEEIWTLSSQFASQREAEAQTIQLWDVLDVLATGRLRQRYQRFLSPEPTVPSLEETQLTVATIHDMTVRLENKADQAAQSQRAICTTLGLIEGRPAPLATVIGRTDSTTREGGEFHDLMVGMFATTTARLHAVEKEAKIVRRLAWSNTTLTVIMTALAIAAIVRLMFPAL
ncbi:MAG: hypothetical protein U0361_25175 [Nitrospiraceae bacterium]